MERRNEAFWRVRLEGMKANGKSETAAKAWIDSYLAANTDRPKLDRSLSTLVLNDVYHGIPIPRVDDDGRDEKVQKEIDEVKKQLGRLGQDRELQELKIKVEKLTSETKDKPESEKKPKATKPKTTKKKEDVNEERVPGSGGQDGSLPPRQEIKQ